MVKNHTTESNVKYAPILSVRLSEEDRELGEFIEKYPPNFTKKSTFAKYLLTLGAKQFKKYGSGDLEESSVDSSKVLELQQRVLELTEQLSNVVYENNALIKAQSILLRDFMTNSTSNQSTVIQVPNNSIQEIPTPSHEAKSNTIDGSSESDIQDTSSVVVDNETNNNSSPIGEEKSTESVLPSIFNNGDDDDDDDDDDDSFAQTFLT